MFQQRCPRCHKGRIFRGMFAMNDPCPVCGLIFQREEGYFLGAMYVSYILSAMIVLPLYLLIAAWRPSLAGIGLAVGVFVIYLPFVPMVGRYSRVLWIYFERAICPSDASAPPTRSTASANWTVRRPQGVPSLPPSTSLLVRMRTSQGRSARRTAPVTNTNPTMGSDPAREESRRHPARSRSMLVEGCQSGRPSGPERTATHEPIRDRRASQTVPAAANPGRRRVALFRTSTLCLCEPSLPRLPGPS